MAKKNNNDLFNLVFEKRPVKPAVKGRNGVLYNIVSGSTVGSVILDVKKNDVTISSAEERYYNRVCLIVKNIE